ncbi:hypothetical protein M422DRAFT_155512, partial [Sphaerobolus stellatus SS14]
YPDWISKAQSEIDAIVGSDRMPTFKDRPLLPYVTAIVQETLRWRPAARFGMPHQSIVDDIVDKYFIPKGSVVFFVPWAIEHDQRRYKDPDSFQPNRFLDDKGQLKPYYETSVFGFGKRSCLGIPFAERALWINIAMMLWTFNIRKSEELDPKTGSKVQYDASDAAFQGTVRLVYLIASS